MGSTGNPATAPDRVSLPLLPAARRTRFAPAPTGLLHLGHVANALWVWGVAALTGAAVVLRIEDHDRQRSRAEFDAALLEDLAWLGFVPDEGPVRQSERGSQAAYRAAADALATAGLVYRCSCSRSTMAAWAKDHGERWSRPGCPGGCRDRTLPGDAATSLRVDLGDGDEPFDDLLLGPRRGAVAPDGDLVIRDRAGNWTYGITVVVDDDRGAIDLVIRGDDLADETPRQIRLGDRLGRATPPRFLHHPLIRKPGGAKLSKSDGDTGVRDLRATGWSASKVRAEAARLGRIPDAVTEAAGGAGS